MRVLVFIACILLIIALGVITPSLIFIGIGHLISSFFKLTLFDSTMLCAASTLVFYFIAFAVLYGINKFMDKINIHDYIEETIKREKRKMNRSKIHAVE